jgi:catechol 2,3-dioxygenase-like lactoylglutathione lyase family enzyme
MMLADYPIHPVLPVSDLARAREFYEGVLGLTGEERIEGVGYTAGGTGFLVYPSAYAGTNKATAAGFEVPADAFDAEVAVLREKGLVFQTFEYEGITWEDGVATMGEMRSVWFADPDGNILAVSSA